MAGRVKRRRHILGMIHSICFEVFSTTVLNRITDHALHRKGEESYLLGEAEISRAHVQSTNVVVVQLASTSTASG